jgi:hypothetical protein
VAKPEPLIRFETDPGGQMQADFATIRRGKDRLAVFIATLGWSRATFVEFVTDERMETLLGCHERAFHYFGGVPREVLYDYLARHIIVTEEPKHSTKIMETLLMGLEKRLLRRALIRAMEGRAAHHAAQRQHLQLDLLAAQLRPCLVPIDLAFLPRRVTLRHAGGARRPAQLPLAFAHVFANRRFRHHLFRPFRPDPLPDPMRRVSLLAWRLTVAAQDGFNERHQPREHRPAPLGFRAGGCASAKA